MFQSVQPLRPARRRGYHVPPSLPNTHLSTLTQGPVCLRLLMSMCVVFFWGGGGLSVLVSKGAATLPSGGQCADTHRCALSPHHVSLCPEVLNLMIFTSFSFGALSSSSVLSTFHFFNTHSDN